MHELNTEQKHAANFKYGIASVLAVPGSGKTLTMTSRIGILVSQGVSPEKILGLTFTRNSAHAMKENLRPILGKISNRVYLATIHSFCYRLLRAEGKQFDLIHGKEQLKIIKKAMKKCKVKSLAAGMILREISLAKANLIDPQEFRILYQGDSTMQKIATVHEAYEKEKRQSLSADFDDLLIFTLDLLQSDQNLRNKYQNMYSHILVDEFQDSTSSMVNILKLLIGKIKKDSSFWVCGDEGQSIYSFTGASIGNILNFKDQFKTSKQYILNTNYRSTPQILKACQNLISHNRHRVDKELLTINPDGNEVIILEAINEEDEAVQIVNEIRDLVERLHYSHRDICVLYRANYQSRTIEEALSRNNIPYYIESGANFFERYEVRIILDYLRLINNPDSPEGDEALKSVINIPNRYIGRSFIRDLEDFADTRKIHLYEALRAMPIMLAYLKRFVKEFIRFLDPFMNDKLEMSPSETIHAIRSGLDIEKFITNDDIPSPDDSKIANINQLQMVAGKYRDIESLLNYTDSFKSDISSDENGVRLMTIHKAKGLEFPVVFLIGMLEGVMPHRQGDLEEERRIAFVGLSRAMKQLYVSYARTYMKKTSQKSRFLDEMFKKN